MKAVKNILISFFIFSFFSAHAEFKKEVLNLGSARDFITLLEFHFPLAKYDPVIAPKSKVKSQCRYLFSNNKYILGGINPSLGSAPIIKPGIGFVRWWSDCLNDYIQTSWEVLSNDFSKTPEKWLRYYPNEILSLNNQNNSISEFLRDKTWETLSIERQKAWIANSINSFIGPKQVIDELNSGSNHEQIVNNIWNSLKPFQKSSLFEVGQKITLNILLREEAISY